MPLDLTPKQPPYYQTIDGGTGTGTYKARITQTGTSAPIATIIQNTTGLTLTWTRDSLGIYQLNVPNTLSTKIWIPGYADFSGNSTPVTPLTNGSALAGYYTIYWFDNTPDTTIEIDVYDTTFTESEWSTVIGPTPIQFELQILP